MIGIVLAGLALVASGLPTLLFLINLRRYLPPPPPKTEEAAPPQVPCVSVLIPARNEERSISAAIESALSSKGVELEVIVLDDQSEDATAARVQEWVVRDQRVRLVAGPPLPEGWCGKQHACAVLANEARYPLLLFVDADVRLAPDGLIRLVGFLEHSGASLVSGIPRQETGTMLERLVIPLVHFVLLGFLPIHRMRTSTHPAYAAGCGQLFLARRKAYEQAGGHQAIRTSLHDGITLPRAFRKAGYLTDLCDATVLANCRMYHGAGQLWRGLAKNAIEGMGNPRVIGMFTFLLLAGQILPLVLLALSPWLTWAAVITSGLATVLLYLPALFSMRRFQRGVVSALLHPLGVLVLLAIQWYGLGRWLLGRPAGWKGRHYPAA